MSMISGLVHFPFKPNFSRGRRAAASVYQHGRVLYHSEPLQNGQDRSQLRQRPWREVLANLVQTVLGKISDPLTTQAIAQNLDSTFEELKTAETMMKFAIKYKS